MEARTAVPRSLVALALLALGSGPGCTIIIEPPDPPPGPSFLLPFACVPVAVDATTGDPDLVTDEEPPTAQVIFTARLERTAVNLVSTWSRFMEESVAGLAALGLHVTSAVLLPLEERPTRPVLAAWGCGLDDPERLTPEEVLTFHATAPAPPEEPLRCALSPLLEAGRGLTGLTTDYPAGLGGTSGRSIFGEAPDLLVVVHLDPLARRLGIEDPQCGETRDLAARTGDAAAWLAYAGPGVPLDRVVHWFVATEEGIDDVTLAARCRDLDGFPVESFDALEASPRPLYGPVSERIQDAGGPARSLPMCQLLVEDARHAFLIEELAGIAGRLDLRFDPALLLALLGDETLRPEPGAPPERDDDEPGG